MTSSLLNWGKPPERLLQAIPISHIRSGVYLLILNARLARLHAACSRTAAAARLQDCSRRSVCLQAAKGNKAASCDVLHSALQVEHGFAVLVSFDKLVVVRLGEHYDLIAVVQQEGIEKLLRLLAGQRPVFKSFSSSGPRKLSIRPGESAQ